MGAYIRSIDRTNPIGNLVAEYAEDRWRNGFLYGFVCGFSIGLVCCIMIHKK